MVCQWEDPRRDKNCWRPDLAAGGPQKDEVVSWSPRRPSGLLVSATRRSLLVGMERAQSGLYTPTKGEDSEMLAREYLRKQ